MVFRQVQCFKVEVVALDFRAFFYTEAHMYENILNALHRQRQWMQMALRHIAARQGNVNLFTGQACGKFFRFKLTSLCIDGFFHFCFGCVDNLADFRTFLSGQAAHTTQDSGELALLAQILYTDIVKRRHIACGFDFSYGSCLKLRNLFFHLFTSCLMKSKL